MEMWIWELDLEAGHRVRLCRGYTCGLPRPKKKKAVIKYLKGQGWTNGKNFEWTVNSKFHSRNLLSFTKWVNVVASVELEYFLIISKNELWN